MHHGPTLSRWWGEAKIIDGVKRNRSHNIIRRVCRIPNEDVDAALILSVNDRSAIPNRPSSFEDRQAGGLKWQ
jgi:hypothetical protein